MYRYVKSAGLFFLLILFSLTLTSGVEAQPNDLKSLSTLVKTLSPSVVNISTRSVQSMGTRPKSPYGEREGDPFEEFFERFFGDNPEREFRRRGLGSGFIISSDGYIITNNHVVERATDIEVVLQDDESYKAEIVGTDPKTDIALLKIKPKQPLPAVSFGNSERLEIGDWVVAIGNPFGLGHTVTAGIISAKGRSLGLGAYDDFIQTDAAINPGNSGGPLFDLEGRVVGVNTAIFAGGQGIGFAIPSSMASQIVEQLKRSGKVVRGWIGVLVQEVTPELAESIGLAEPRGALVADVTPDGPAEKAGLKRGDVIVELNGSVIEEMPELPKTVASYPPGTKTKLKVIRNGSESIISIKLGELPEQIARAQTPTRENEIEHNIGLVVQEINPRIQRRFNIDSPEGVIITNVNSGSIAEEAGLSTGDIILEINKKQIKNLDDYRNAIDKIEKGDNALFLVKRDVSTIYVALKIQ